jgi:hypothetical protein
MRPGKLGRTLLELLAAGAVLALFIVADWYPALRDLGRLRRERGDLERKVKDYSARASAFVFPDEAERKCFALARAGLEQALPQTEDASWLGEAQSWLRRQAAADGIARASMLVPPAPDRSLEPAAQADGWLAGQLPLIEEGLGIAAAPERYFWNGVLPPAAPPGGPRLACRPLAVVMSARLPALSGFINHATWGDVRLEIVRLRVEACAPVPRAWLVLRGFYLGRGPSPWAVPAGAGSGDGLLLDVDSPLLWQRVDAGLAPGARRRELPPARGRGAE